MSSDLARQLRNLTAAGSQVAVVGTVAAGGGSGVIRHEELPVLLRRKGHVASLLFDPAEAADIHLDTVFQLGLNGWLDLCQLDGRFHRFERALFSASAHDASRDKLTPDAERALNATLTDFLVLLSPHFMSRSAQKALEWLVRRFRVQELNVVQLLACALPYHSTTHFTRLVQILYLHGSPWEWLEALQAQPVPLPRSTLVERALAQGPVLQMVLDLVPRASDAQASFPALLTFYTTMILDVVATATNDRLERVLPALLHAVANGVSDRNSTEHQLASYLVVARLARRSQLSPDLMGALLEAIPHRAPRTTEDGAKRALLCMMAICQCQTLPDGIPLNAVKHLIKFPALPRMIASCGEAYNVGPFLRALFPPLIQLGLQPGPYYNLLLNLLGEDAVCDLTVHASTLTLSLLRAHKLVLQRAASVVAEEDALEESLVVAVKHSQEALASLLSLVSTRYPTQVDLALNAFVQEIAADPLPPLPPRLTAVVAASSGGNGGGGRNQALDGLADVADNFGDDPLLVFLDSVFSSSPHALLSAPGEAPSTLISSLSHSHVAVRLASLRHLDTLLHRARRDLPLIARLKSLTETVLPSCLMDDDERVVITVLDASHLCHQLPPDLLFVLLSTLWRRVEHTPILNLGEDQRQTLQKLRASLVFRLTGLAGHHTNELACLFQASAVSPAAGSADVRVTLEALDAIAHPVFAGLGVLLQGGSSAAAAATVDDLDDEEEEGRRRKKKKQKSSRQKNGSGPSNGHAAAAAAAVEGGESVGNVLPLPWARGQEAVPARGVEMNAKVCQLVANNVAGDPILITSLLELLSLQLTQGEAEVDGLAARPLLVIALGAALGKFSGAALRSACETTFALIVKVGLRATSELGVFQAPIKDYLTRQTLPTAFWQALASTAPSPATYAPLRAALAIYLFHCVLTALPAKSATSLRPLSHAFILLSSLPAAPQATGSGGDQDGGVTNLLYGRLLSHAFLQRHGVVRFLATFWLGSREPLTTQEAAAGAAADEDGGRSPWLPPCPAAVSFQALQLVRLMLLRTKEADSASLAVELVPALLVGMSHLSRPVRGAALKLAQSVGVALEQGGNRVPRRPHRLLPGTSASHPLCRPSEGLVVVTALLANSEGVLQSASAAGLCLQALLVRVAEPGVEAGLTFIGAMPQALLTQYSAYAATSLLALWGCGSSTNTSLLPLVTVLPLFTQLVTQLHSTGTLPSCLVPLLAQCAALLRHAPLHMASPTDQLASIRLLYSCLSNSHPQTGPLELSSLESRALAPGGQHPCRPLWMQGCVPFTLHSPHPTFHLALAALPTLTPAFFSALPTPALQGTLLLLVLLLQTNSTAAPLQAKAATCIRDLPASPALLVTMLEAAQLAVAQAAGLGPPPPAAAAPPPAAANGDDEEYEVPAPQGKRARHATPSSPEAAKVSPADLAAALSQQDVVVGLVADRDFDPPSKGVPLIAALFSLLQQQLRITEASSSSAAGTGEGVMLTPTVREYSLQLLLATLARRLRTVESVLDHKAVHVAPLVRVLRVAQHPSTQDAALLVLGAVAALRPPPAGLVAELPSVLSLVGDTLQRVDRGASWKALRDTLDRLVPALREMQAVPAPPGGDRTPLVQLAKAFASAWPRVPAHRRFPVYSALAAQLGPRHVYPLLAFLFRSGLGRGQDQAGDVIELVLRLLLQLPPSEQIRIVCLFLLEGVVLVTPDKATTLQVVKTLSPEAHSLLDVPDHGGHAPTTMLGGGGGKQQAAATADTLVRILHLAGQHLTQKAFLRALLVIEEEVRGKDEAGGEGARPEPTQESEARARDYRLVESAAQVSFELVIVLIDTLALVPSPQEQQLSQECYTLIGKLSGIMSARGFVKAIRRLLNHPATQVRERSLGLFNDRLQHSRRYLGQGEIARFLQLLPALEGVIAGRTSVLEDEDEDDSAREAAVGGRLEGKKRRRLSKSAASAASHGAEAEAQDTNRQTALLTLEILARHFAGASPGPFLSVIPAVQKCMADKNPLVRVSGLMTASALCEALGLLIMPFIKDFLPALVQSVRSLVLPPSGASSELVQLGALTALHQVVRSLSSFLSAVLPSVLDTVCRVGAVAPAHSDLRTQVEVLQTLLVRAVPDRVLLPALLSVFRQEPALELGAQRVVFTMLERVVTGLEGEAVATHSRPVVDTVFQALEARPHERGQEEEVTRFEDVVITTLLALMLKMSEVQFSPLLLELLQWSGVDRLQPRAQVASLPTEVLATLRGDPSFSLRAVTLFRTYNAVIQQLQSLHTPFQTTMLEPTLAFCSAAVACTAGGGTANVVSSGAALRQAVTQALAVVTGSCVHDRDAGLAKSPHMFDRTIQALAGLVGFGGGDLEFVGEALGPAVQAVASHLQGDANAVQLWRSLNSALLRETRVGGEEVRVAALRTVGAMAERLAEEYSVLLPETVPFFAARLEDEKERVEEEARAVLSRMEKSVGQSLDEYFN